LRACKTTPVTRNTAGKLHFHGALNPGEYVGKKTDDWYTDAEGRKWFKTGDQARLDEQGRIFIIGRYKDIVIRGGKNLARTAIEANLAKNPKLIPYNVQIVAAPDLIAGEVPAAVTEISVSVGHALEIQNTLRVNMGREYVPDEVISAEELGLRTFPRTLLGKSRKSRLERW
jgi:acyl-coenzyme A synthetase/AMP-(fatty) acid ligase